MGLVPRGVGARLRQWEIFTAAFFNYMLVTPEGQRVRGRFIRAVCWRIALYVLAGAPLYGLLYLIHWISLEAIGRTIGFVVLAINCALGLALLQTIREYRSRIQLYFPSQFTGEGEEDDLPVGHREIPEGPRKVAPPLESDETLEVLTEEAPSSPAPGRPIPAVADHERIALRCQSCRRACTLTGAAARKMTRCQYCGGQLEPA